jgi:hypothetical protein
MKLKRIRKVEYNDNGEYPLSIVEKMLYPVHFIDNEDWLCIDEEDYTLEKIAERKSERGRRRDMGRFDVYQDTGNGLQSPSYVYMPYIPIVFEVKDGKFVTDIP